MYIETERLIIRSFRDEDAAALYQIKMDGGVLKYMPDFLKRGAKLEDMLDFIHEFARIESQGDINTWRCYAVEDKENGHVAGSLTFGKQNMLCEYTLGWQIMGEYTGKGYASEAAAAFAEYFCGQYHVDYLIAVMDVDNPASYRTALKSGFRLFEKRTVFDDHDQCFYSDYYYFRRYYSQSGTAIKFYGDCVYDGRGTEQGDL